MPWDPSQDHVFYRSGWKRQYPVVDHAEGVYMWDTDGRRYLDAAGGAACVTIGYGVQSVLDAMDTQARRATFAYEKWFASEARVNLAKKVIDLSPGDMSKVYFVSGGSEATEIALKIARRYHIERGNSSKYKIISRWFSYHGSTLGAMSMTGRQSIRKDYTPYLIDFPHIGAPYCYRCPFGLTYPECNIHCAHDLETTIKAVGPEYISAFIFEPAIAGSAPGVTPVSEYYGIIKEICEKYDVLMIADEIVTGFGRTGKPFGMDHWEIVPDIIATGKGMASGYIPFGSVIMNRRVADAIIEGSGKFGPGHTYAGNPLACATALAVLEYSEEQQLTKNAATMGNYVEVKLAPLLERPYIGDIRVLGLLVGIEFVANKESKKPFDSKLRFSDKFNQMALARGLIVLPHADSDGLAGDTIELAPPLCITHDQIDEVVTIIIETLDAMEPELMQAVTA